MVNFTTEYIERQSYIARQSQILLNPRLFILDEDVGDKFLMEATVLILESEFH